MKITVYTTPDCVQCESTKRQFERFDIPYEVVDLSKDEEALKMVRELGYTAAPVVIAGSHEWSGFRLDRIKGVAAEIDSERAHNANL